MWLGGTASNVEMGNDAERSLFDQVFYLFILGTSWLVASSRRLKWGKLLAANISLVLLYIFFAVSVAWSSDPVGSSKRLIKVFGLLFVISIILSEKDPLNAIRAVYCRCACVLFPLSVVVDRYFPTIGKQFMLDGSPSYVGVTTQKNGLGEIVLVLTTMLLWDCLETSPATSKARSSHIAWDRLALLLMGVWLLNQSQSKTALTCLVVCVGLSIRKGWLASKMTSTFLLIVALSLPFLMLFAQQSRESIAPILEGLGRDTTFTGRANIWAHISPSTVNPVIGAGYWNFWGGHGGFAIAEAMHTPIPNAHSGYLDIYLDGGAVGVSLLFLFLLASGWRLIANIHVNCFQRVRFAFLIAMILYNLSESTFLRLGPTWFTMLVLVIQMPRQTGAMRRLQYTSASLERNHLVSQ